LDMPDMDEIPLVDNKLMLRNVTEQDLPVLYQLVYGEASPEWKLWDAPYFPLEPETYDEFAQNVRNRMEADRKTGDPCSMRVIETDGQVIGTITYYWEHKPSLWLEMGIVMFQSSQWGRGYGTRALKLWIGHLFDRLPIARVGLTTWSGNERMMRAAAKNGLQIEGRMRKCRIVNGQQYDSIRMGMLREEWLTAKDSITM